MCSSTTADADHTRPGDARFLSVAGGTIAGMTDPDQPHSTSSRRSSAPVDVIGPAAARRIVLAAQGFGVARPAGPITRRHLVRTLDRIRLLQLDSVNVAVRAHYMPVYSRLGEYDRALVDDAAWTHSARRPRLLVEDWAHEASLLPVRDWPLLRAAGSSGAKPAGWWRHYAPLLDKYPGLADDVLA